MANEIITPLATDILIENGIASVSFSIWLEQVTEAVKPPLVGSGSPEGVVIATIGRWYVDTDTVGTGIYLKESGEGNTGWIARS